MSNKIDKRMLNIFKSYHPAFPEETSKEDFEYAKALGYKVDRIKMTHDEAVSAAFDAFAKCERLEVSDAFIVGLSRSQNELRAGLPAFAIMSTFPRHSYINNSSINCADCAMMKEESIDFFFIDAVRYTAGGIINKKPATLAFCLKAHCETKRIEPSDADVKVLINVLDCIMESPLDEKPSTLVKRIRKLSDVKMSVEQARHFINTLGYAGILDTKAHQGFIFKHATHLVPRKTHSSDWAYPVDFWIGSDGVNFEGLRYWFGQYPQVLNWIDSKSC